MLQISAKNATFWFIYCLHSLEHSQIDLITSFFDWNDWNNGIKSIKFHMKNDDFIKEKLFTALFYCTNDSIEFYWISLLMTWIMIIKFSFLLINSRLKIVFFFFSRILHFSKKILNISFFFKCFFCRVMLHFLIYYIIK